MFFDPTSLIIRMQMAQADREIRERYWSTLPDEVAEAARAKWDYDEMILRRQRDHELAVARAGRPLNFWGN